MSRPTTRTFLLGGLLLAACLAMFVAPFASQAPDGLDSFAIRQHIPEPTPEQQVWQLAPLADYQLPCVRHEGVSTAIAGLLGVALVFGAATLLAKLVARRSGPESERP